MVLFFICHRFVVWSYVFTQVIMHRIKYSAQNSLMHFFIFPFSSIIIIPYCELFYAIMFLMKVVNLTFHFHFPWSSSQEEHARIIQASLLNLTSDIKKAMAEAEANAKGSYQHNISTQIQLHRIYYLNFNEPLPNFIAQYILWYIYMV